MLRAVVIAALALAACKPSEAALSARIDAANTCQEPADCVDVGSVCPFGCNILVNTEEADDIRRALANYIEDGRQTCPLDCDPVVSIDCDEFRCVPSYTE
jgi:hypothetical protein